MEAPVRKKLRLEGWDYGQAGAYFVTICAKDKQHLFGRVVGAGVTTGPQVVLSAAGRIVEGILSQMPTAEKYVVMPNHIHAIFVISDQPAGGDGPMGTSAPTVPGLVRYLKRAVSLALGQNIWQRSFYDHIIRSHADYLRIWQYIDTNPAKWEEDCYYAP